MVQQLSASITMGGPFPVRISALSELLTHARESLGSNPQRAMACLDRIADLFEAIEPESDVEAMLLPSPRPSNMAAAPARGGLAPWQLRRALTFVERHLSGPVPIEALAKETRLSNGHFCRAFKVTTGETPHNFLIRQRIRHAQRLMLTSNDTLSQIACACGLTDQAHLTRLFRKLVGETPLVWRRARQRG
ncbi:MAG: AraC family transcriptional regulator [Sphingomonas sp.]|nr:AraC family transcriptional regulator [Sphingomonas sp.]